MAQHYHSIDTLNGARHTHETIYDLDLYMKATGTEGMRTTNCYDPTCLEALREDIARGVFEDDEWGDDNAQQALERGPR
jgi:hypothetical protein